MTDDRKLDLLARARRCHLAAYWPEDGSGGMAEDEGLMELLADHIERLYIEIERLRWQIKGHMIACQCATCVHLRTTARQPPQTTSNAERDARIVEQHSAGRSLGEIADQMGLSVERIKQIVAKAERAARTAAELAAAPVEQWPIKDCGFSFRTRRAMADYMGFQTAGDLFAEVQSDYRDFMRMLMRIPDFGEVSRLEIIDFLAKHGVKPLSEERLSDDT